MCLNPGKHNAYKRAQSLMQRIKLLVDSKEHLMNSWLLYITLRLSRFYLFMTTDTMFNKKLHIHHELRGKKYCI